MQGQGDDLGGGVWKKRLDGNRQRSIILARGGSLWFYEFLFEKQNRANIDDKELKAFKKLAKVYEDLQPKQITALLERHHLTEICT